MLALGLCSAGSASAGDYTVRSCKEEAGSPVHPVDGWQPLGSVGVETIGESCFRGGSLWARLPGGSYSVGTHVGWKFDAPAGTEIVNYRISRSTTVGAVSAGNAAPVFYVAWPAQVATDIREICFQPTCSALGRRDRAVPENIITPPAPMAGVRTLHFVAQCGGTAGGASLDADSPPGAETVRFDIHAAQITLRDSSAPAIGALTGPLAEPGRRHAGTTTVTARATDAGAGVASFTLEVDGQAVASAAAPGCQAEPFTARTPCPTDIGQSLELDTTKLPVRQPQRAGRGPRREREHQHLAGRRRADRQPPPRGPRRGAQLRLPQRPERNALHADERQAGAERRSDHADLRRRPQARLPVQESRRVVLFRHQGQLRAAAVLAQAPLPATEGPARGAHRRGGRERLAPHHRDPERQGTEADDALP